MSKQLVNTIFSNKAIDKYTFRANLQALEDKLLAVPGVTLRNSPITPLVHRFAPGLYCREITIPAGFILTTAIHKTEHIAIISKGKCLVASEQGTEFIEAPHTRITKIGTKRAIHVIEEIVWSTIHAIDASTPEEATAQLEFTSFQEYEDFIGGTL